MILSNNYVDKVYLALELTKLSCNSSESFSNKAVSSAFRYFIKDLTGIDNFNDLEYKDAEIEKLRKQNSALKENSKHTICEKDIKDLIAYINSHGGDMEYEVKKSLLSMVEGLIIK